MSEQEILSAIDRFINKRCYHYAMMIDGKWGSGKTFFVEHTLLPYIQRESSKDVNYISLYGIKSTDDITKILSSQAIRDKVQKVSGRKINDKVCQVASLVSSSVLSFGASKIGEPIIKLDSIIELFPSYDNNVIIFDDLERCSCDINEVMGYINSFIEHTDASVILIANEEEIGKWQLDRNPELQMMVALNKSLKLPTKSEQKDYFQFPPVSTGREPVQEKQYTLSQLEKRRAEIFHSNENYYRMKEKLIGQTITYVPDLRHIYPKLIENADLDDSDNNKKGHLKEELIKRIDDFAELAEKEDHYNLRTFQFFLEKVKVIYDAITNRYADLDEIIITYTFRCSVHYKKGLKMPKWEEDFGVQSFGKELGLFINNNLMGFRFVDELIEKNIFDKKYVDGVLARYSKIFISNDLFFRYYETFLFPQNTYYHMLYLLDLQNLLISFHDLKQKLPI